MEPIILPRISDQKPLVSVISITYNHEPYIRDCLEGFMMQKTNFPVEVIIHDDASTDHTADIIREYYEKRPDLFHVIIERENLYSQHKPIMQPLCDQAKGKYIALCEGDDYWTDSMKLQRQFDFMESNHNYVLCGTRTYIKYQTKNKVFKEKKNQFLDIKLNSILESNPFMTCSIFLNKDYAVEHYKRWSCIPTKLHGIGDLPLWIFLATKGKCYILPDYTCYYRILKQSACHGSYEKERDNIKKRTHIILTCMKEYKINYSKERLIKKQAYFQIRLLARRERYNKEALFRYWKMYWRIKGKEKPYLFKMIFYSALLFMFCNTANKRIFLKIKR